MFSLGANNLRQKHKKMLQTNEISCLQDEISLRRHEVSFRQGEISSAETKSRLPKILS